MGLGTRSETAIGPADSPVECKPRFREPSPINKYDPPDDCRCQIAELNEGGTRLKQWATFATLSGGAAAALTGLLFVAVSIRIEFIAKSTELRSRAAQTLTLFVIPLVISILLSIPDQGYRVLGAELVLLAAIGGGVLLRLGRQATVSSGAHDTSAEAVALLLDAVAPNWVTSVLLVIAGMLLLFGVHAGLYVLVLPVLVALVGGVLSAWLVLTKITD